jgi:histidinol-phosphate phosphatase family protein
MAGPRGERVDAVVLAGGRGTRSADPSRAKLAQEVGGSPLMTWHLRLLEPSEITDVIVVAGHLGHQVQALCDELQHEGMAVRVIHEERQEGTVAALRLAAAVSEADAFLVVLGDILMSFPVQHLLDDWRASGVNVAVAVHPSTHPEDSDAAFPAHDGSVLVVPKSDARDHVPNMSSAGLFAITRAGLEQYASLRDVGSDVLPAAAARGDLFAFVSSHYFKDTGTPARLAAARGDLEHGAFARRGDLSSRPALFLDRDGVINPTEPEFYVPDRYVLLPGVADAIGTANRAGIPVIVVTNQPALAKGLMTFEDHQRIRARMDRLLGAQGAFVDDYFFCPHHPDSGFVGEVGGLKVACECRKPDVDMARQAARRHGIDLARSAMVGDTERDRGFARATAMHFVHVSGPHESHEGEDCFPDAADAIRRGIEVILC